jgi:hypothetical protein
MLDAYYCTTAGVVQGTSHLSRPVHGSIAGHAEVRHRRGEGIHNPWCLARSFPCATRLDWCWLLLGGTRTHTRTTRRIVNTRLRAVNGRPTLARVEMLRCCFSAGVAEGA